MNEQSNYKEEINELINLGVIGQYPLFFKEWINDGIKSNSDILSNKNADQNIYQTIEKLSKHKSYERKKIALMGLDENERNQFVSSFFKVIEGKMLEEIKELH